MSQPAAPSGRSSGDDAEEDLRGPHLWLNWQGMIAGQLARSSSRDEFIAVHHPVWEERALYSDADISGELDFGPYKLLMTLSGGGRVGRPAQQLVLRHDDHLLEAPPDSGTDELDLRGWTGGDLGDQAAALLSLAISKRVRCGGVVRQGFAPGDPLGRPMAPRHRPPTLVEPAGRPMLPGIADAAQVQGTAELWAIYSRLDPLNAAALTRAAGQYADALWWADADPRIAWIKLVGALEAAANRADISSANDDPVTLLKRHRGALYGKLKRIDPAAARVAAENLAGTMRAEAKLLEFTLAHAPAPPQTRPGGALVDFNDLGPSLAGIYEWRSRDLHDGIPFPPPLCEPPIATDDGICERFPALAVQGDGGTWPAEKLPMYLHVFAHIVGGALRAWWQTLDTQAARDAAAAS